MKKDYKAIIYGETVEQAEILLKVLDRYFRANYNVYGVHRDDSKWFTDSTGKWFIISVTLSAIWYDNTVNSVWFPDCKDIIHGANTDRLTRYFEGGIELEK